MDFRLENKIFNQWDEVKRQMEVIRAGNKLTVAEKQIIIDGYTKAKNYWKLSEEQRVLIDYYTNTDKGTILDCWNK